MQLSDDGDAFRTILVKLFFFDMTENGNAQMSAEGDSKQNKIRSRMKSTSDDHECEMGASTLFSLLFL